MGRPDHYNRAQFAVYAAQVRNRLAVVNALPQVKYREDEVFSRMYYTATDPRDNSTSEFFEFIEPLVGILRDPLTMCEHFSNVLTPKVSSVKRRHAVSLCASLTACFRC